MQKLFIINKIQFGYHTDTFKYCKYLSNKYSLVYICFDSGKPKIELPEIEIKYINWSGNILSKAISFIKNIANILNKQKNGIVFVECFQLAFFIPLLNKRLNYILDIRTLSVNPKKYRRLINNFIIKFNSKFYRHITIVNIDLAEEIKINKRITYELPLGGEILEIDRLKGDLINLVYIGTLDNRNVFETVEGLHLFLKRSKHKVQYNIIGSGKQHEIDKLLAAINYYKLEDIVKYHGHIPLNNLREHLARANIGISWIPIKKYFQNQPPTKTFDYLLSGLYCLATSTESNKKIIREVNGVLCEDSPEGFANGISNIIEISSKNNNNNKSLIELYYQYSWENIVHNILLPYLEKIK